MHIRVRSPMIITDHQVTYSTKTQSLIGCKRQPLTMTSEHETVQRFLNLCERMLSSKEYALPIAIYMRVSTAEQSVNIQQADLQASSAQRGFTSYREYCNHRISGTKERARNGSKGACAVPTRLE